MHTAELGKFVGRAGYDVRHFYAVFPDWGLGNVSESTGVPSVPLEFQASTWNAAAIQKRFRDAVDTFAPDFVIITDTWNSKPLLAEAMRGYRYFLRLAAMECLCPLNNVRLLVGKKGEIVACPRHQLATPDICRDCVAAQSRHSGMLHQAERALSGYGTAAYTEMLLRAFAEAEGVLVVNPLVAAMVSPFAKKVHVIPSGFDPARFPRSSAENGQTARNGNEAPASRGKGPVGQCPGPSAPSRLIFAGLVDEYMKGFRVVHDACEKLWRKRRDFELVATADPVGQVDEFTRYIGWQSQDALPAEIRKADILVFPTIAEEALGRTAVEAMGAEKPVIASRIGGLQFTVADGTTGLLCEPGNVDDLAAKIETLLDDSELRRRMGQAGRKRFEEHFTWDVIINRHYKQLMPLRVTGMSSPRPDRNGPANPSPLAQRPSVRETRYTPRLLARVDTSQLLADASTFFGMERAELARMWETYRQYSERQEYATRLGELKTLSTEEAFLIGILLSLARPAVIVELGTQHGKSTRRLVDLQNFLGLGLRVVSYDVTNELQHVGRDEIEFCLEDLTGRFRSEVLDQFTGGLVFCDVHPYPLLSEVVRETAEHPANWALAVHDCTRGLCNPRMLIGRDDPHINSDTGVWERYVLAERFGIDNPLNPELDFQQIAGRRMRIFETQHGLALDVPATIWREAQHAKR
ncbi:MAG: glycosyltransferase family 4 protein [Planctomycetia bacterium]|nr:glycosyltransferase family 4 protein [Planctomycetia bacterium]